MFINPKIIKEETKESLVNHFNYNQVQSMYDSLEFNPNKSLQQIEEVERLLLDTLSSITEEIYRSYDNNQIDEGFHYLEILEYNCKTMHSNLIKLYENM